MLETEMHSAMHFYAAMQDDEEEDCFNKHNIKSQNKSNVDQKAQFKIEALGRVPTHSFQSNDTCSTI